MNELAQVGTDLKSVMEHGIVSVVPAQIRKLAADAIDWFEDRPSQGGIDFDLAALKLAGHLHEMNATAEEIRAAIIWLDKRVTFRPLISDYRKAIDEVRENARMHEFSKLRTYFDPSDLDDGRAHVMTEERAREIGFVSQDEFFRLRMVRGEK